MREYDYTVDRDGRVFHEGSEITDPAVLRFFLRSMQRTADGRYLVVCQHEHNWFAAADTPFVIQRLSSRSEDGRLLDVDLCFAGDYREALDADTLETEGGFLYCRVRRGDFRARFGRIAVQQLAPFLTDGPEGATLLLRSIAYPLRPAQPSLSRG